MVCIQIASSEMFNVPEMMSWNESGGLQWVTSDGRQAAFVDAHWHSSHRYIVAFQSLHWMVSNRRGDNTSDFCRRITYVSRLICRGLNNYCHVTKFTFMCCILMLPRSHTSTNAKSRPSVCQAASDVPAAAHRITVHTPLASRDTHFQQGHFSCVGCGVLKLELQ